MTVYELRELLKGVDDAAKVLIPVTHEFDGRFYSPCSKDSGATTMGTQDLNEEDVKEMELLNKPTGEENVLLLIPCGFYEDKDHTHELN